MSVQNYKTEYANSVFEQPWFLDVVCDGQWKEMKIEDNGKIVARWAIAYNGKKIFMPEMTQTLGFWIDPELKESRRRSIILELIQKLPNHRSFCVMLHPENDDFLPFIWNGYHVKPRVTYRFDDLTDPEAIEKGYSRGLKSNIHQAKKVVTIIEEDNVERLYALLESTFRAQKRSYPTPKKEIQKLFEAGLENNACKILTAIDENGNAHASSLFLYDEKTCYYLLSGADRKYQASRAPALILDTAIQFASKVSAGFDFEGSMIQGIENFFRRFGAKRTVYYEISKKNLVGEIEDVLKPRVKKLLGYKM